MPNENKSFEYFVKGRFTTMEIEEMTASEWFKLESILRKHFNFTDEMLKELQERLFS